MEAQDPYYLEISVLGVVCHSEMGPVLSHQLMSLQHSLGAEFSWLSLTSKGIKLRWLSLALQVLANCPLLPPAAS